MNILCDYNMCIVCHELRPVEDFVIRSSGYKCPGCVGKSHKHNNYINVDILTHSICCVCDKPGQINDFYKRRSGYKCKECVGISSKK